MKKLVLPFVLFACCLGLGSCGKKPSLGDANSACDCCDQCQSTDQSQGQSCGCCDQCGSSNSQY